MIVSNLNGRNPEELTAFMVLKDEDAEFEKPVTFNGGLSVMKQLDVGNYNGKNLSQLLSVVSANVTVDPTETKARSLLTTLQKSTAELADFEYFEQIQHVSFSFPHGSSKLTFLNDKKRLYRDHLVFSYQMYRCTSTTVPFLSVGWLTTARRPLVSWSLLTLPVGLTRSIEG